MHQGDALASAGERVLNCHLYQALGSSYGNRLDADAGIKADLLFAALQHVFIQELDKLCGLGSSLLPLDPGIYIFGIFAINHDVHALGMLHRRRRAFVIFDGSNAGVKIENLPQRNVQRTNAASDWSSQWSFYSDAKLREPH